MILVYLISYLLVEPLGAPVVWADVSVTEHQCNICSSCTPAVISVSVMQNGQGNCLQVLLT